ncbi:MAG: MarR family winged helix-turn-helix transcriptional regulator [Steroidobacteraceae bacterium]
MSEIERSRTIWNRPGFLIRRLQQIQVAAFLSECSESDITPVQWGILTIVSENPGVGQIEISEELGLDRSNVANVVERLTKRGLLRQKLSSKDRRKKYITLTKAGERAVEHVEAGALRAQRKIFRPLSGSELEIFVNLLTRLVKENNHLGRALLRLT